MAQQITNPVEISELISILGNGKQQVQGSLFAPTLLPRQLPVYHAGPEDDSTYHRLANRGPIYSVH